MKTFVMDLWYDLRQKRLWPVAVVLVLALVAVPVVLSKPAEEAPIPPVPTADRKPAEADDLKALAAVKLDESAPTDASDLDTFEPSNPFRPPASARPRPVEEVEITESVELEETVSEGGGSSDGGSVSPTTPTTPPDDGEETETTQYQYVIDVTFTANGRTRKLKGMHRLDMLPREANPLLLFLGVSADGGNGVFLIDSTLAAVGEGSCKPTSDECSMLYLGAGSEHQFTNELGDSYELRIDEIRKVKMNAKAATAKKSVRAGASRESTRRFVPELISDLVSVSTEGTDTSTSDSDGR